ncbi:uncharacterized protein LOC119112158 [Pollicipes pollicipes]|uniref:uncharacterized protein LOC119112158 n=1 Tax=Pollicipes pollicipes TaxID=41117 RepID=UPI001884B4D8|nr:uncharacterized protein LOC119112158 [Pollicipes pollicipes]XP_037092103.1 uncharacterized protein LOC119112158 [Pollicipes pollicipes]XP_037092104.1 uncharacterized protein LOC119112158 [Pollicipes pollicipes]
MPSEGGRQTEAESLAALDQDLLSLHQYCSQSNLSPEEVREALRPLVSAVQWSGTIDTARSVTRCIVAVLLICAAVILLMGTTPFQEVATSVGQQAHTYARIAMVKVLPYWDWSTLCDLRCLIENPLYQNPNPPERSADNCHTCESMSELDRLSNVSVAAFTENYMRLDRPIIVTDATKSWPAFGEPAFDRHRLVEMFKDDKLADSHPCELLTNLMVRRNMKLLLDKMSNPVIKKWFAHWENCDKMVAKALRTMYRRPYFLPTTVDTTESNWVLVSSNYTGSVYKMLPVVNDLVWMAQVQGTSLVRLAARDPCTTVCPEIVDTLRPGEILVFTDFMWMMDYMPGHGTDNVAIGTAGFWE